MAILLVMPIATLACRSDLECSHLGNGTRCDTSIVPCLRKDYECLLDKNRMVYAVAGDSVSVHCDYSSIGYCSFETSRKNKMVDDSSPFSKLPLGKVISCQLSNCTISRWGNDLTMACNESLCACVGECDKFVTQALSRVNGYCAIQCHQDSQNCTISHHAFPISISADCSPLRGGIIYECVEPSSKCIHVYDNQIKKEESSQDYDWTFPFAISLLVTLLIVVLSEFAYTIAISAREAMLIRKEKNEHHPGIVDNMTIYSLNVYSGKEVVLSLEPVVMRPGCIYVVIGKSGCGKTTFFKALSNRKDRSNNLHFKRDILVDNTSRPSERERNMFSLSILDEDYTNQATASLQFYMTCLFNGRSTEEADKLFSSLDMSGAKDTLARNLSRGQKSRLSSGDALLGRQPVVIMDEPFANLDIGTQRKLAHEIHEQARLSRLIILSTHEAPDSLFKFNEGGWRENVFVMIVRNGKVHHPIRASELIERVGEDTNLSIASIIAGHCMDDISLESDDSHYQYATHIDGSETIFDDENPSENGMSVEMDDMASERGSVKENYVYDTVDHSLRYKHGLYLSDLSKYRVPSVRRIKVIFMSCLNDMKGAFLTGLFLLLFAVILLGPSFAVGEKKFDVSGCKSRFVLLVLLCIASHLVSMQHIVTMDEDIASHIKRIVSGHYSVRDFIIGKLLLYGSSGRFLFFALLHGIVAVVVFPRDWDGPHRFDWVWLSFIGASNYFINIMIHTIIYSFSYSKSYSTISASSLVLMVFSGLSGILLDSSPSEPVVSSLRWASPWSFAIESSLCLLFNEREIEIEVSKDLSLSVDGSYWINLLGFSPNGYWRAIGCLVVLVICSYYAAQYAMRRAISKHGTI